jgi:hypothetical protein
MLSLKIYPVFASLYVPMNRVLKVRGHTFSFNRQAHLGARGEESTLLNWYNLPSIHTFMKPCSELVGITIIQSET